MTLHWYGPQAMEQAQRAVGMGMRAGVKFASSAVKQTLSIPAPRRRVKGPGGVIYYRALTRATPGAPPRKLSGRLRASVTDEVSDSGLVGRVGTNVIYARRQEFEYNHKFLVVTIEQIRDELAVIVGKTAQSVGGG